MGDSITAERRLKSARCRERFQRACNAKVIILVYNVLKIVMYSNDRQTAHYTRERIFWHVLILSQENKH